MTTNSSGQNPYFLADTAETPRAARETEQPGGALRPVLWLLLVVFGAANVVSTTMNLNILIGLGFGLLTLSCGVALGVHHYRHRRS
jgi:hypothetical protein